MNQEAFILQKQEEGFRGNEIVDALLENFKDDLTREQAIEYASNYAGWTKHGEANRWGREIGIYSWESDRTVAYECPDCKKIWGAGYEKESRLKGE